jgi:hypothetical protein
VYSLFGRIHKDEGSKKCKQKGFVSGVELHIVFNPFTVMSRTSSVCSKLYDEFCTEMFYQFNSALILSLPTPNILVAYLFCLSCQLRIYSSSVI